MVYCHDRQVIFIHIPKTGGTTVELELGLFDHKHGYGVVNGKALQHLIWKDYVSILGLDTFNNYFKFAIVRNPYDRIVSEYYWCPDKGIGYKGGQSFDEFLDYCQDVIDNKAYDRTIHHDHYMYQSDFIFEGDTCMVDILFKFEQFDKVKKFLTVVTSNKHIPQHNKGHIKKLELTDRQKDKIYNIYKIDFERLGYSK